MKLLCAIVLLVALAAAERMSYEGYKIYSVTARNAEDARILHDLSETDFELDFLELPRKLNIPISILVPPMKQREFEKFMTEMDIAYTITNHDIETQALADYNRIMSRDSFDLDDFNRYDWIMEEMENMVSRCPEALTCQTWSIGESHEGRELKVLYISSGEGKQGQWVDSLIHAREWLAGTTVLRIMDALTRDYGTDVRATYMVDSYDWYFLPVMNPDGYEFTHTTQRFWRKSRRPNDDTSCMGTDLNRNYDHRWGQPGASDNPCSDTYRGASVADNVETAAVQAEGERLAANLVGWTSVHTTANMWLIPFGDCSYSEDWDDQKYVADVMCDILIEESQQLWWCDNSCELLYATSGTTSDWSYGTIGVKYSYTPELRGPGFNPDRDAIEPSFNEVYAAMEGMVDAIFDVEGPGRKGDV